jgi:mRNA interferase YafQ
MLAVVHRKKFKKNLDLMILRGKSPEKIKEVILALASGTPLDSRYKDHALSGSFSGFRDCHIDPDWLMIYRIEADTLYLERTGSHSDIF